MPTGSMPDSRLPSPAEDLQLLRSAAVAAGIIAVGFFRHAPKAWTKENASPVTEADIAVDRYLNATLLGARPSYGWLSEETVDDDRRLTCRRVFVIDPIDGTRGFIRGDDSWTISLAVAELGRPTCGVVYAPARDEMFEAVRGGGARRNGVPLVRHAEAGRPPLIPGARRRAHRARGPRPYLPQGTVFPLARLPPGAGRDRRARRDGIRRGASDWDIAGAAAILTECGISLEDVCTPALVFNRAMFGTARLPPPPTSR